MNSVVVGQRWISHNEANLGLGMIQSIEGRRMEIYFPAVNESRHYAIDNAPVSRIIYQPGDQITDMDEQAYQITEAIEHQGLMIYACEDVEGNSHKLSELHLNCYVQFNAPDKRLLNGQLDKEEAYQLRYDTFLQLERLNQSSVSGLLGSRVELLPHQLYIAHEVSKRQAPRVLLADEVGLGKTIEAGMILHQQLHTGQSSRVLILVPDSLVHQWLVEMLRRFNLRFALFDQSRFAALSDSPDVDLDTGEEVNPFEMEQLIICSMDELMKRSDMQDKLKQTQWDLLVVDEAHHLHWNPLDEGDNEDIEQPTGDDYKLVEMLGEKTAGLLLLTATPEQAGVESHFARLRLLDPNRFHDLEAFKQESSIYSQHQSLINLLANDDELSVADIKPLLLELPELETLIDSRDVLTDVEKQKLLDRLIDQHGTGRVLFRNTRSAMSNFPERQLHSYPLPCPEIYTPDDDDPMNLGQLGLTPEIELVPEVWLPRDPRVEWLLQKLTELKGEKVLVIAHHASTALTLQEHFSKKYGLRCTCFHEGLSLFERDRSAAYFADREEGAQVMFCSEIGSEGRNFQFAHHMIFFDLPNNPDLVEQRIGRLDRIGQTETINVHVPFLTGASQEVLFRWYHEGLNLFEKSFSAGYSVYEKFHSQLTHCMEHLQDLPDELIEATQQTVAEIHRQMEAGRDRLLELNSCRQPHANQLVEQLEEEEQANRLASYFERLLEEFGVEQEDHSSLSWVIRPSDHMKHSYFPGLKEDGNTVTLDRLKALSRDDIEFLSWEHPMVVEAMDMMIKGDAGNAAMTTISVKGLKPGTLLLESYFTLQSIAPKHLQLHRYMSQAPVRLLVDVNGKDLSQVVSHDALNGLSQPLKRKVARQVIQQVKPQAEKIIEKSDAIAQGQVESLKASAIEKMQLILGSELARLVDLQKTNASIRSDEIERLKKRIEQCEYHIRKASLQMQGLKLVVAS
ncbi:RNA polymerase-associated protein RapA [Pleionea sediminis]|uniref:RNA polymerase-associated protein RapA n=1 Tax=Pleionea sediminis TaxID=2569479 RepID=UPI00118658E0|nr:RNA polymerase-associated protein RapA [Pleionea sediminis]